tara:strand:+ start:2112 stop:3074 length:963 start_codon:yes stop_codon:yes gene_type:complete
MAYLYYGNGECTIEGSEIRGVQIKYDGNIRVEKTAGDNFALNHKNNGILVFPIGEGYLNDLFKYRGTLNIISVIVASKDGEFVECTIKRVMDYSNLLNSTAETMTTNAEDLSVGHDSFNIIGQYQQIIENLHTKHRGQFYLKEGGGRGRPGEWITFNHGDSFLIDVTLGYNQPLDLAESTPNIFDPQTDVVISMHYESGTSSAWWINGTWLGSLMTLLPGHRCIVGSSQGSSGQIHIRSNIAGAKPAIPGSLPREIPYEGEYHIHLKDSACMTGATHDENSQDLYFKQVQNGEVIDKLVPTKSPSHVPPGLKLIKKKRAR